MTKTFNSKSLGLPEMISGQAEAVKNCYDVYKGKSGFLWLVANNIENKADAIYRQGCKNSDGFGGASLDFNISHGDTITLKGPWKAASGNLLKDTGVDVSEMHYGYIVIGKELGRPDWYEIVITDVIYDSGWQIGKFPYDTAEAMAQEKANELNIPIYFFAASLGGTTSGCRKPELLNSED